MARRPLSSVAHGLFWPILALAFCAWIVALAGISAVQRDCSAGQVDSASFRQGAMLPVGVACGRAFRWVWWILWGTFFVLLYTAITFAGAGGSLPWHLASVGLLAAIFPLLATAANFSLNTVDALGSGGIGGGQESRAKTMFAGFLMTAALVAALMIAASAALGFAEDDGGRRKGGRYGSSYEEEGRAGVGAGAPRARAAPPAPAGTAVVA